MHAPSMVILMTPTYRSSPDVPVCQNIDRKKSKMQGRYSMRISRVTGTIPCYAPYSALDRVIDRVVTVRGAGSLRCRLGVGVASASSPSVCVLRFIVIVSFWCLAPGASASMDSTTSSGSKCARKPYSWPLVEERGCFWPVPLLQGTETASSVWVSARV